MSGFGTIKIIRDFEQTCYELGFEIAQSRFDRASIALKPMDDRFPHYSRDAELFSGSIEEAIVWLRGIQWARDYDDLLKVSTDKKRSEQEQKERNRQLMKSMKTGRRVKGTLDVHNDQTYEAEYDQEFEAEDPPF